MLVLLRNRSIYQVVLLVLASISLPCSADRFSGEYDQQFKRAVKRYAPFMQWTNLKAQCYQESLLNPLAVSHAGAKGLCQFMNATWGDVSKRMRWSKASQFNPSLSIEAAAYYDASLYGQWSSPRPWWDRMSLMYASYNAGLRSLLKAQRKCGNAPLYRDIESCLHMITGHNSVETKTYVERIWRWNSQMRAR